MGSLKGTPGPLIIRRASFLSLTSGEKRGVIIITKKTAAINKIRISKKIMQTNEKGLL